ncbi:MAG: hypothetical protein NC915_06610 [Candidatus Omnitrophica bacterium]|nr:hypothetical protein [Candidatus Omnitrophota bacterium]
MKRIFKIDKKCVVFMDNQNNLYIRHRAKLIKTELSDLIIWTWLGKKRKSLYSISEKIMSKILQNI